MYTIEIEEYEENDCTDDNTDTKKVNLKGVLVFKCRDDLYITKDGSCYIVTIKSRNTFYPSLASAFKALSNALLLEHFGRIPDEEKNDLKRVLRALDEHSKMIEGMFRGY